MSAPLLDVYDTTLRDGAQMAGLSLSVEDKLAIARHLDDLGVGFIEGGWPGANPKDVEFFRRAADELRLRNATLAAFGSTARPHVRAADDPQVAALREAGTPVVTLVAKAAVRHVSRALRTELAENLRMVTDTVEHLVAEGRRVFCDAEHFFDGYAEDPAYALAVVEAAAAGGAEVVALCDTNGGTLPDRLGEVVAAVVSRGAARIGVHCHDDSGCAVASSLAGLAAGASHVQGTANGYGERCGNANLFTVVAALELKLGRRVLPPGRLSELSRIAHAVAELANIPPDPHAPYVGTAAFAHKGGLHASAVRTDPMLYQHVRPDAVGNELRLLVSELAGRATVELTGRRLGLEVDPATSSEVVSEVKRLEAAGYAFEAAEASFELLLRRRAGRAPLELFDLESWRVIVERRPDGGLGSEATVKLRQPDGRVVATGEGVGPVHALDQALRAALETSCPALARLELVDYKVRIVDGGHGTGAVTRVLVQTSDGQREWTTVGVDENIIAASWQALADAYTYGLLAAGDPDPAAAGADPDARGTDPAAGGTTAPVAASPTVES